MNYRNGQQYKYHYDWFTEAQVNYWGGQRVHTMILYLNDIPKEYGGGTKFWELDLTIEPKKNSAVYFRNVNKDGAGDTKTIHSGEVLLSDKVEKWAINS